MMYTVSMYQTCKIYQNHSFTSPKPLGEAQTPNGTDLKVGGADPHLKNIMACQCHRMKPQKERSDLNLLV